MVKIRWYSCTYNKYTDFDKCQLNLTYIFLHGWSVIKHPILDPTEDISNYRTTESYKYLHGFAEKFKYRSPLWNPLLSSLSITNFCKRNMNKIKFPVSVWLFALLVCPILASPTLAETFSNDKSGALPSTLAPAPGPSEFQIKSETALALIWGVFLLAFHLTLLASVVVAIFFSLYYAGPMVVSGIRYAIDALKKYLKN